MSDLVKIEMTPEGLLKAATLLTEAAINGTRDAQSINAGIHGIQTMIKVMRLQLDIARFKARNPEVHLGIPMAGMEPRVLRQ
jgi:hypothetical protein